MQKYLFLIILFGLSIGETKIVYPERNINLHEIEAPNNYIVENSQIDSFGNTHIIYQQAYKGVPVFGSFLRTHFSKMLISIGHSPSNECANTRKGIGGNRFYGGHL